MTEYLDIWKIDSNTTNKNIIIILLILGIVFTVCFHSALFIFSEDIAGFILGIILISISSAILIIDGKQEIILDSNKCIIHLKSINRFGKKEHIIRFDEISDIYVREIGHKKSNVRRHCLIAKLKNGKSFFLYSRVFYDKESKKSIEKTSKSIRQIIEHNR